MKKSMLFWMLTAVLCISLTVNAQIFTVKAGYNLADMKVGGSEGIDNNKSKSGFHVGAAVEFPIKGEFSFEPGLYFSNKGCKTTYQGAATGLKGVVNLNYIDMPLNFRISFPTPKRAKYFIAAGPYLSSGLFGKSTIEEQTPNGVKKYTNKVKWGTGNDFKRFDYGISVGGGVEVKSMQFSISYDYGLSKILDLGSVYVNNRVLKFSVGYRFGKQFQKI